MAYRDGPHSHVSGFSMYSGPLSVQRARSGSLRSLASRCIVGPLGAESWARVPAPRVSRVPAGPRARDALPTVTRRLLSGHSGRDATPPRAACDVTSSGLGRTCRRFRWRCVIKPLLEHFHFPHLGCESRNMPVCTFAHAVSHRASSHLPIE